MNNRKKMVAVAEDIRSAKANEIKVRGKRYKIRRLSGWVRGKIDQLNKEALVLGERAKKEMTLRKAKRISRRLYSLHSKTATCYLLGRWAAIKPLYAVCWRWISLMMDSEQVYRINEGGMKDPQLDFSLANWHITNAQLALSMELVGKGMDEYQKRMESAEKQAREDGTPTSQESKSEVSSSTAPTTSE